MGVIRISDETSDPSTPIDGLRLYSKEGILYFKSDDGTVHEVTSDNNVPFAGDITNAMLATDIKVGSLAALGTVATASVQAAINELHDEHGNLGSLATNAKGTFVAAINEMDARIDALVLASGVGDTEVIDARSSEASLRDRLNKSEANVFNVLRYGAIGDGGDDTPTDDTIAIRAAISAASAAAPSAPARPAPIVYFPPGYAFYVTDQIDFGYQVSVVMESPIIYEATATAQVAVLIGDEGTPDMDPESAIITQFKQFKLWVESNAYPDWTADAANDRIGIRLCNFSSCKIEINLVYQFTIGVQCYSNIGGWAYNEMRIGRIIDCKIGLHLYSVSYLGWVNENLFLGGSFGYNSGVLYNAANETHDLIGILIEGDLTALDVTNNRLRYAHNKNTFIKPSFELGYNIVGPGGGSSRCVVIISGGVNTIYDARVESCDPVYFGTITGNTSYMNRAEYTYSGLYGVNNPLAWEDASGRYSTVGYASNTVVHGIRSKLLPAAALLLDSGPVYKTACPYNGAGTPTYHVPRVALQTSSATPTIASNQAGLTIASDYLLIPNSVALGIYIDTSAVKRFALTGQIDSGGNSGTINVLCFNSGGSVLYNAAHGSYYVEGEIYGTPYPFVARTAFGNSYYVQNLANTIVFQVHADVKSIFLSIADCRLKNFDVYALPQTQMARPPAIWTGYEEIVPGCNIGTAAPTTGTWARGRRVYNAAPAASGVEGWICVDATTPPGTWRAFGAIAS